MSKLVDTLINANLVPLKPYESARRLFSGGQDWLNANESPFANPYEINDSHFNRYPSCQPSSVISGYARYANVDTSQLIVTRGADEGIELLIRTFCTPGNDSIVICPPTYGMYAISAETCNVGIKRVPLKPDFNLDVDAICAIDDVNLIFICAPNNPTGTQVNAADVERILAHFSERALVVMDEAYIEFDMANTWADKLNQYPNLVVLRTLSKAFALAGLRCGFTLANDEIIQALMKVIAPYPIPEPVAQIVTQALDDENIHRMREQVNYLNNQRDHLRNALATLPGVTLMGDVKANYILFRHPQSSDIMQFLVSEGMLIRDQSKQLNLQHCLRVTVGNAEQNQRLLALLTTYFKQSGAES